MIAQYIIPIHVRGHPWSWWHARVLQSADQRMYETEKKAPSGACLVFRFQRTEGLTAYSHLELDRTDRFEHRRRPLHTWMGFCRRDGRVQCNQVPAVNRRFSLQAAVGWLSRCCGRWCLFCRLNAKLQCCWFNLFIGLMLCDKAYLYCLLDTLTAPFTSQQFLMDKIAHFATY